MNDLRQIIQGLLDDNSSLSRIEHILAWILRFVSNARLRKKECQFHCLSVHEINSAHRLIIRAIQSNHIAEEKSYTKEQIRSAVSYCRLAHCRLAHS